MKIKKQFLKAIFYSVFFTFKIFFLHAELISSDVFNYSIDFPEGFSIADCSQDERAVLFEHTLLPVQTAIRVWPKSDFKSSEACLSSTLKKISGIGEITSLKWRNQDCALSQISIPENILGTSMSGWATCIPLPQKEEYLCILCYAPKDKAYDCEQFILSTLDSIMIDRGSFRESGIVTQFAYPRTKKMEITLEISGTKIKTAMDKDDAEANQFVVDREFAVFSIFASEKSWKEAWQRFYRMIAKDSMGRTKRIAFDISSALYAKAMDDAQVSQALLTWTQNFNYERKSASADKADFTNIPAVILGSGSDCDSRSMLLMVLFKNMNLDSCMFISVEYSHAMAGIVLDKKQGQYFELDGKHYLTGETTAKNLTWGLMPADMQDRSKWIPVELYD